MTVKIVVYLARVCCPPEYLVFIFIVCPWTRSMKQIGIPEFYNSACQTDLRITLARTPVRHLQRGSGKADRHAQGTWHSLASSPSTLHCVSHAVILHVRMVLISCYRNQSEASWCLRNSVRRGTRQRVENDSVRTYYAWWKSRK